MTPTCSFISAKHFSISWSFVTSQGKTKDSVPSNESARLINNLLGDRSKRERMGKYGRQKVERDFGWNQVATNLLNVYEG